LVVYNNCLNFCPIFRGALHVSCIFCEGCAKESAEEEMKGDIPKVKRSVEKRGRYAKVHTGTGG